MELDRQAVERVLRRASDLSAPAAGDPAAPGLISEQAVLEAATEVGLDPRAVLEALAQERLGPAPIGRVTDNLVGPVALVHERVVATSADEALMRLDNLFVKGHGLRPTRSRGHAREWRRRDDAVGSVRRAVKGLTGDATIGKLMRIEASAGPIDEQRTIVRVVVDRRSKRRGYAAGGAVVGGAVLVGTVVGAIAVSPLLLIAAPVAAAAGGGVALAGRHQATVVTDAVEGVLDDLERGTVAPTLTDALRGTLRSLRSSPRP